MSTYTHHADAAVRCCSFCVKPLPIANGELQPWRAASGLFFCSEFCADDAEEARFQSRARADRKANNLGACPST
jgi:ribosomal protein L24E